MFAYPDLGVFPVEKYRPIQRIFSIRIFFIKICAMIHKPFKCFYLSFACCQHRRCFTAAGMCRCMN